MLSIITISESEKISSLDNGLFYAKILIITLVILFGLREILGYDRIKNAIKIHYREAISILDIIIFSLLAVFIFLQIQKFFG